MNKNNFHYVAVLLDMLYGLEIDDEDLEELGLLAWDKIGNKSTRLYMYRTCLNSDNSIELPCNASSVESVTIPFEDSIISTNKSNYGDFNSQIIETDIEAQKVLKSPYYIPGKLISYEQVGSTLYFPQSYGTVNILYKGIIADEDGLPELTDKEANAIATYIAYVYKYKEGLKTNNTVMINLATNLENKWLKQCDQARVTGLNQNDMNEILNIKNSWNRKNYSMSYKFVNR